MGIIEETLMIFINHPYIVSFISGLISEELIVFTAILSGRGLLPLWIIFVFGAFGTLVMDSIWFWFGRSKIIHYLKNWKIFNKGKKLEEKIHKISKKHQLLSLILTKFVFGTRIISIVYHSAKEMPFRKFLIYDALAVLIWTAIMVPIGWLAGNGFDRILHIARGTERIFAIIFIVIVIFYAAHKFVTTVILRSN